MRQINRLMKQKSNISHKIISLGKCFNIYNQPIIGQGDSEIAHKTICAFNLMKKTISWVNCD